MGESTRGGDAVRLHVGWGGRHRLRQPPAWATGARGGMQRRGTTRSCMLHRPRAKPSASVKQHVEYHAATRRNQPNPWLTERPIARSSGTSRFVTKVPSMPIRVTALTTQGTSRTGSNAAYTI